MCGEIKVGVFLKKPIYLGAISSATKGMWRQLLPDGGEYPFDRDLLPK